MSGKTVQPLDAIVAAVAAYDDADTVSLAMHVGAYSHCKAAYDAPLDQAQAWTEQWSAPEETHPNIPQHRWNERTAMIAARLCAPCPVKEACLALNERAPELFDGYICGGLTPQQRRLEAAPETVEEGR